MKYVTPDAFRTALETRLLTASERDGVSLDRLRRRAVFERILVRLERAQPGVWVLKGGMALEVRLRDRARATKDLDLAIRGAAQGRHDVHEALASALATDPDGDWFLFNVGEPTDIEPDDAGRPGWRFPVTSRLALRLFAQVRVDVVARIVEISATERTTLPGMLGFADLPSTEVELVSREQHFAEKLHALTRSYGGRPNTRVKDLPDLIILIEDGLEPSHELLRVVEALFAARNSHPVPVELPDPPADWDARYPPLVVDLDIGPRSVQEAMSVLRAFWARTRSVPVEDS